MQQIKDQRLNQLILLAKPIYANCDDPTHDYGHITRVMRLCRQFAQAETCNLDILLCSALLHDIVNVPKNSAQRSEASQLAANKAAKLMQQVGYKQNEIKSCQNIIFEHSFSLGAKASSIESALLQDADKIDALGAIGIMRTVSCGVKMGTSYYQLDDPMAITRELDDKTFTLDHFYKKLFLLPKLMNTSAGKKEANRRVSFMQIFVDQLKSEI